MGGQFKKGQSGNPNGRPKGALNKSTKIASLLLRGHAEAIARKAIELALDGNIQALWICLRLLVPATSLGPQNKSLAELTREQIVDEFRSTRRDVAECRAIMRDILEEAKGRA